MRPIKNKAPLALAALLMIMLTACGKSNSQANKKQEFSWSTSAEISTIDMSKASDTVSFDQLRNTMEGLYRTGKNGKLMPALATSSTVSKDGKTYTFTLRKSKWSDGSPVTAKDFVYSWRRTVNPKTASEYAYLFEGIKNATAITAGKKPLSSLGVKADGDYKLVVTLDRRIPYFKNLMAFALFFPQSEKAVKKYGSNYGTASKYMLYNGPYVQKGWTGSNLSWKMVKNKYYWDKKNVKIQQIDWSVQKTPSTAYNLYQSNKLDALSLDSSQTKQLSKKPGFQLINNGGTAYLQYNLQKDKNLANLNIRRAISMAIDRSGLCSTLGGNNQPAKTFTAKGVMYVGDSEYTSGVAKSSEAYNKYSKTEAKKLFNKGLAELGKSSITISIMADDTDSGKKTVEALQSELTQTLGKIKVETTTVPFKTRMARREAGKFDVMVSTWIADFNDAISFLDLLTSNNTRNYGKWSNSEYDRLIADSKVTASSSQRVSDLQKAEAILLEDEGITPIYYISTAYLIRPEIKNVYNDNLGGWQFKYASVK